MLFMNDIYDIFNNVLNIHIFFSAPGCYCDCDCCNCAGGTARGGGGGVASSSARERHWVSSTCCCHRAVAAQVAAVDCLADMQAQWAVQGGGRGSLGRHGGAWAQRRRTTYTVAG